MHYQVSSFYEVHNEIFENNLERFIDSITPWLLNNSIWIVTLLAIIAMAAFAYYEKTRKVAKSDKELMDKYIFLKRKGIV